MDARRALLAGRLGATGDHCNIRAPFYCDYGTNISLGDGVFLNFNCVILDVVRVTIGDRTQIGPGVQILTARPSARRGDARGHARIRAAGRHRRDVWIGGAALILPGVTVGDGAIIGAGAVVNRDVPAGATVAGNPARMIRESRMMSILPPKPFYMIRHGQTDANLARICSGGAEATLTDLGEAQASAVGALLAQVEPRPTVIIHSGRTRTIGTAERLNATLGLAMECDPRPRRGIISATGSACRSSPMSTWSSPATRCRAARTWRPSRRASSGRSPAS